MKTTKLSAVAVMAVLALWTAGCGVGTGDIIEVGDGVEAPQQTDDTADDTNDEVVEPEDPNGGDEGGGGGYHPQPLGDGEVSAVSDHPMASARPEVTAIIPATPHDDEPYDLDDGSDVHAEHATPALCVLCDISEAVEQ